MTRTPWSSLGSCLLLLSALCSSVRAETCAGSSIPQWAHCATPAYPVDEQLWGELEPVDNPLLALPIHRDTTDFDGASGTFFDPNNLAFWTALDVEENGLGVRRIFATSHITLRVWEASGALADNPTRYSGRVYVLSDVPVFYHNLETKFYFWDVDAPPDQIDVVAAMLTDSSGLVVVDTSDPAHPQVIYQDYGASGYKNGPGQVYATTLGGRHYAFMAAGAPNGGVFAYDLSSAQALGSVCTSNAPASTCGVFEGMVGSRITARYLDGADQFLALSSGALPKGVEVWDVADPSSPVPRIDDLPNDRVHGVALWAAGETYYLATRIGDNTRVYDVGCIDDAGSCSLGSPVRTFSTANGANNLYVTWSRHGSGREFLHLGDNDRGAGGLQHEWMIEVTSTDPAEWADITPPAQEILVDTSTGPQLRMTGYWGWYYLLNPTGFNFVAPMMGKWYGDQFYRAAWSIFDIHQLGVLSPPLPPIDLAGSAVGMTAIDLSWAAGSTDHEGFRFYRDDPPLDGDFVQIDEVGPSVTTYQDTGLTEGTEYAYHVTAFNSVGEGAPSSPVNVQTVSAVIFADDLEDGTLDAWGVFNEP